MANVTLVNGTEWIVNPQQLHQRDHEAVWLAVRSALDVTASEFSAVVNRSVFTTRQTLMDKKSGKISNKFVGNIKACQWGLKMEPKAFRQYADVTGNQVVETGLHVRSMSAEGNDNDNNDNDSILLGASPDGLVVDAKDGSKGLLEIKCLWGRRNKKELPQFDYCPNRFFDQIQGQLAVCNNDDDDDHREWCDLMLYIPPSNRYRKNYCIVRVNRNREYWSETLLPALQEFCAELKLEKQKQKQKTRSGGDTLETTE